MLTLRPLHPQCADLRRIIYRGGEQSAAVTFRVYRLHLREDAVGPLNTALSHCAREAQAADLDPVQVSNIGGWHSSRDFFSWKAACASQLRSSVDAAVEAIEADAAEWCGQERRPLEQAVAAWLNVSERTHWNKMHDHFGAVWSGCYYVSSGMTPTAGCEAFEGCLLLKPSPGPLEDASGQVLSDDELRHVAPVKLDTRWDPLMCGVDAEGRAGVAEYALVEPQPGTLVVFPSWLLHCVLPTCSEGASESRISCAFNVTCMESPAVPPPLSGVSTYGCSHH